MKIKTQCKCLKVLMVCLTTLVIVTSLAHAQTETVTLVGEINDTHQLVTHDEIYDIADTPLGDDLVKNYVSAKVEVTGTVQPGEEQKIIRVKSFKVVDE